MLRSRISPLRLIVIAALACALALAACADAKGPAPQKRGPAEIANYGFNDFYGRSGDLDYFRGRVFAAAVTVDAQKKRLQAAAASYMQAVASWQTAQAAVKAQLAKTQTKQVRWRLANLRETAKAARALKRTREAQMKSAQSSYNHALTLQKQATDRWGSEWKSETARVDRMFYLTKLGAANTYRVTLSWRTMQPERGVSKNWWYYDYLIKRGEAFGLRPIITITGAPCWARPSVVCNHTQGSIRPDDKYLSAWKLFAAQVASRYPQARAIEIWNEPNAEQFWGPRPSPAGYVKVLKAGYEGVKAARPSMRVITGGLSPAPKADWNKFLSQMYALGADRYSDVLGLHPYPHSVPLVRDSLSQIDTAKAVLKRNNSSDPVWITEYGISTQGQRAGLVVGPRQQAALMAAFYQGAAERGINTLIVHKLVVYHASGWSQWDNGLSMFTARGKPKPVYCELASLRDGRSC